MIDDIIMLCNTHTLNKHMSFCKNQICLFYSPLWSFYIHCDGMVVMVTGYSYVSVIPETRETILSPTMENYLHTDSLLSPTFENMQ